MGLLELFIIAVGLSMDAFAVSICKGLSVRELRPRHAITCGVYFGGFQSLMPLIGWLLGAAAVSPVVSIFWMSMCWSMIFGGVGDFYNVRNVIQQVPRGAYVFNYGLHTYWIEDPRKKK